MVDVAEEGFCMHCIRDSGLLVRGDPRHEVTRDGRRYWFPDVSHRDAFLAAVVNLDDSSAAALAGQMQAPLLMGTPIVIEFDRGLEIRAA